jgi:metal-dependent HD superfamily phosphatase/phosphodiesterase
MRVPTKSNNKLKIVLNGVNSDVELNAIWEAANVMAVKRLKMSDHGPTHVAIVANLAIKILRNLVAAGIEPSVVTDWEFENSDAEVIVFLGAIMHDLGNAVHRDLHDDFGVTLANTLLHRILPPAYKDPRVRQIIITESLHAMVAHDTANAVHTIEGGVVRIADGLDMKKGRSRIAFEVGEMDIYNVSGMAVDKVTILPPTEEKPVRVEIIMTDAAGIFQVDYLLKKKIQGSGLESWVEIIAKMKGGAGKGAGEGGERLIDTYKIE